MFRFRSLALQSARHAASIYAYTKEPLVPRTAAIPEHDAKLPTAMPVSNHRDDRSSKRLEATARTAMEQLANHTLTDVEWDSIRIRFLEFANILRGWDQPPLRGTVGVLCQREP